MNMILSPKGYKMTIAEFVRMQRKNYKLTQRDLAVTLPLQSQKFDFQFL